MVTFFKKLSLFLILLVAINHLIYALFWRPFHPEEMSFPEMQLLDEHLQKGTPVIYMGDSTIKAFLKSEPDHRSISSLLQTFLKQEVATIDHAGYSMDMYYELFKYIVQHSPKIQGRTQVREVIIPINLRSFSASWDKQPMYQHISEKQKLQGPWLNFFLHRPLRVFKYSFFDNPTEDDFLNSPVMFGNTLYGYVKDFHQRNDRPMKDILIYHYLYNLDQNQASTNKVKAIVKIIDLAQENHISLTFYFTPLDYEFAQQYLPRDFNTITKHNISFLTHVIEQNVRENVRTGTSVKTSEVKILDLSQKVPSKHFSWRDDLYPNEHLQFPGRQLVAKFLATSINLNQYQ